MGENSYGLRDWREVIRLDFSEQGPVTEETIQKIKVYYRRIYGQDDDTAYNAREERRERVLSTPLP